MTRLSRSLRVLTAVAGIAIGLCLAAPAAADDPPPQLAAYTPFFVHYAPHAESLWRATGTSGYWGDGLADGNGGIRGTSNLTLAMAWLVVGFDRGWLSAQEQSQLAAAGLDRDTCLRRVQASWRYLADCHLTGSGASAVDKKRWGRSWQSPLWVGASGLAALLTWEQLDHGLRDQVRRVVVDEADAKIGVAPRDAKPGNTAAEENGWDSHAPAIALGLFPDHPHTAEWLRAAQLLAVNTYSTPADRNSEARVGNERVRDVVSTTNMADDFTLSNHGFFHPSYVKVSGQELGEAWAMMALGDKLHGTDFAKRFQPYALHHVADVWNNVMRALLLPDGEFAFPCGQDWALHTATTQSYFAFIATSLRDPLAAAAERRGLEVARFQMQASPNARIYGFGDFEWWWEPILLKRYVTAMLHFLLVPGAPAPVSLNDRDEYRSFPDAGIVLRRTPRYFTSLALRPRPTALIIPLGDQHLAHPYVTTPRVGSILPTGTIVDHAEHRQSAGDAVVMTYDDGTQVAMVATGNAVLWLCNATLSSLAIQNDALVTGHGRRVHSASGVQHVAPLVAHASFRVAGTWLNVDGQLGLVSPEGFQYEPAGGLTRRSAAEDLIVPRPSRQASLLLAGPRCSVEETRRLAESLRATLDGGRCRVQFAEPQSAASIRVEIDFNPVSRPVVPEDIRVQGEVSDNSPLANLTDGDPATATVFRNKTGTGPTSAAPIAIEFRKPASAGAAASLRIVPRPGYGPRDVVLEAFDGGTWRRIATTKLSDQPANIALAEPASVERLRLTILSGWDRGVTGDRPPRNTQIAEIGFGPPGGARQRTAAKSVPVRLFRDE